LTWAPIRSFAVGTDIATFAGRTLRRNANGAEARPRRGRRDLVRRWRGRRAAGERWQETGYVFTTPDGQPLHPDFLTRRFVRLVNDSGLPPVRLHDLRHGAASLAHCAGADLKTVQEQLGHTSIVLPVDTYTSVLHEQHVKAAAAAACLVPGTRRRKGSVTGPRKSAAPQPASRPKPRRARRSSTKSRRRQGRPRAPRKDQGRIARWLYGLVERGAPRRT